MKSIFFFLFSALLCGGAIHAQIEPGTDVEKWGFKPGVQWVKRTWYNPLNGTTEPDKSAIPSIYLRPNQLIEFNKEGKLKSLTEFQAGTDDETSITKNYIWKDGRLARMSHENANYEVVYATSYTYDASGNEIKGETKAGAGDKMGIFAGMASTDESSWSGGRRSFLITRDRDGIIQKRINFTYDAKGRVTTEDYTPVGLYSARTYEYDANGNVTKEAYLDKEGKPSTVWTYAYNPAGKRSKRVMAHFTAGKKDKEELTTYTYNAQGDMTSEKTVSDGKTTWDYRWEHKYDARGTRIETAHIKAGKLEYIETLKILYHK